MSSGVVVRMNRDSHPSTASSIGPTGPASLVEPDGPDEWAEPVTSDQSTSSSLGIMRPSPH